MREAFNPPGLEAPLGRRPSAWQLVCVTSEAGAGKTALVTEFARRTQDAHVDLVVTLGDCNAETGIGHPYLPFREVLSLLTGDVEARLPPGSNPP